MEFVSDHIRINLTNLAQKVIESDRIIFGASANSNLTYGAIINKIIENYDDDFAIDDSLLSLRNEDESRIVRLQNDVIEILDTVVLTDYLKNAPTPSVPKYVKCLLESYARLPFIEREKLILKKDVIQHVDAALKKLILLSLHRFALHLPKKGLFNIWLVKKTPHVFPSDYLESKKYAQSESPLQFRIAS